MRTVTILTCDRTPSYLTDTVKTIPEEYNIQYISQGEIVMPKNGEIIHVDKAYASDPSRHRDRQYNYSQALLNTKDGLIVEDDVEFSKNFNYYYENILKNLPSSRYAIALYACYDFWNKPLFNNFFAEYPVDSFYGTQAMLLISIRQGNLEVILLEQ